MINLTNKKVYFCKKNEKRGHLLSQSVKKWLFTSNTQTSCLRFRHKSVQFLRLFYIFAENYQFYSSNLTLSNANHESQIDDRSHTIVNAAENVLATKTVQEL